MASGARTKAAKATNPRMMPARKRCGTAQAGRGESSGVVPSTRSAGLPIRNRDRLRWILHLCITIHSALQPVSFLGVGGSSGLTGGPTDFPVDSKQLLYQLPKAVHVVVPIDPYSCLRGIGVM
jgi:hypothetical protein